MRRKDWIIFVGDLSISYSRGILRGMAQFIESRPSLQRYAAYHVDIRELPRLETRDIAGALIGGLSDRPSIAGKLAKWRIPKVDVAGDQHLPWLPWCVRVDDNAIGQAAAAYLIERGFHRLAYLGHDRHLAMARRQQSFTAALEAAGRTVECFQGSTERVGRRWWPPGMLAWIKQVEKPAAVFCCNDFRASALLVACRRAGIRVPEDIAVLGVDDDDLFAQLQGRAISTVPVPTFTIAARAMDMLATLIHGLKPPRKLVQVPPQPIITRASTDVMAVTDELVRDGLAYLREHFARGVSIKQMVVDLAVSRPTLDKRFMAALGRTPAGEVRRLQLEKTKALLVATELPMPRVALQGGFSSAQQMSVSFRRFVGTTPTQYRNAYSVRRQRGLDI
jgi:LacI family transcriptional regulator